MSSTEKTMNFPIEVCFLDGFVIRHGRAVGACGGVWTVLCQNNVWTLWEDDVFLSFSDAQRAANLTLN